MTFSGGDGYKTACQVTRPSIVNLQPDRARPARRQQAEDPPLYRLSCSCYGYTMETLFCRLQMI